MENLIISIQEIVENFVGISGKLQLQIFNSLLVFLFIWLFRKVVNKFVIDKLGDYKERYFWGKTLKTVTMIVAIIVLSRIWFGIFDR